MKNYGDSWWCGGVVVVVWLWCMRFGFDDLTMACYFSVGSDIGDLISVQAVGTTSASTSQLGAFAEVDCHTSASTPRRKASVKIRKRKEK